jgi:transmembrane sensor
MTKYSTYKVEDFLLDESFIEWVLNDSERDAIFWNAWVAAHPNCVPVVNLAKKTLLALYIKPTRQLNDEEVNHMIGNLHEKANAGNRAYQFLANPSFSYPIAAILAIGLMMGALFYKGSTATVASPDEKSTAAVYPIKSHVNNSTKGILIKLADGSSVILKPGSKLLYPTAFSGKNREVTLEGEAFFEIHKDAKHPFYVYSGDLVTRVVGTSFTVKASNDSKEYQVIVNTGKVLVTKTNTATANQAKDKSIYLVPNQQLVYDKSHHDLVKENLAKPLLLSADVSKDFFNFNDTPLSKVIHNIERAYNVSVIYNVKEIGGCPLTASMADEHLLEKLDLIGKALNISYYINEGQIVLQGKGCNNKATQL